MTIKFYLNLGKFQMMYKRIVYWDSERSQNIIHECFHPFSDSREIMKYDSRSG